MAGLLDLLKRRLSWSRPDASADPAPETRRLRAVVVNDTRPEHHYGCEAVMSALFKLLAQHDITPIHAQHLYKHWRDDPEFLEKAPTADVIVVNGEGTIHHSRRRARQLAMLGPYCRDEIKVPAILLNATLFANNAAVYDDIRAFSAIAVRDKSSAAELRTFGIDDALYAPDLSMFHDFQRFRQRGNGNGIGITDSVSKDANAALLQFGATRELLPRTIKFPKRRLGQKGLIEVYAGAIGKLDLLVTGRYHAVCYAINTMTPFVALESNTNKISALAMDVFGNTSRVLPNDRLADMDPRPFMRWSAAERASLDRFLADRGPAYDALGVRIAELAKEKRPA